MSATCRLYGVFKHSDRNPAAWREACVQGAQERRDLQKQSSAHIKKDLASIMEAATDKRSAPDGERGTSPGS